MAINHVNTRVQKHRDSLRASGLRPIQIWVPDTRRPNFAKECRLQCLLAVQEDLKDLDTQSLMDDALNELDGWVE
jgi:hypothetical protein